MFSTPENLLVWISGALGMKESHFLNKNVCLRKCCAISQKWWMLEISNICHCVQHPWKLTSKDFWSSRNERKPLPKQKYVFEKMLWGYLRTLWMLELSNLCYCVQHPWKLTSRDFWNSGNEGKALPKQKCVLKKCCGSISEMENARAFKPLPLCSAPLKTY